MATTMDENRTIRVSVRLKPDEYNAIVAAGKPLGLKPSTFVRTCVAQALAAATPSSATGAVMMQEQIQEIADLVAKAMFETHKEMQKAERKAAKGTRGR